MNRFRWHPFLWLVVFFTVAPDAPAQRDPSIGYIYPAGGRQGSDIEVTIGGQYLRGLSEVLVSGQGVQASVLKYIKPLTQKEINDLRQKLRSFQKRMQAARNRNGKGRKGNNKGGANVGPKMVEKIASDVGLEVTDLKSIRELQMKISNSKKQLNPQLSDIAILQIQLSPNAAPGKRELRLKTSSGLSNPLYFHVGQWTEYRENEPNDKVADSGVPARLPVIINGQVMPGDVDRFQFTARKGERLVARASARELIPYLADAVPGWFQATLAIYDSRGNEVAYADDFRFNPDPVLCYEVAETGSYVLEIKDAIYRGREDFVYRIALGEIPFVTSIFPLGGRAGKETTVSLRGWNLPVDKLSLKAGDNKPGVRLISVRKGGRISNGVPFAVSTLPECLEVEPNNGARGAQRIELPLVINGRINCSGDVDVFQFQGRAGDRIVAEVMARRLNSPLDSLLELLDAKDRVLIANDDHEDKGAGLTTHQADSQILFTLPADGTYNIRLVDAQKKGGEAFGYRLRISHQRPDFALRVVPSTINARAGTTIPITVYALRKDGFAGDIDLQLKDPPGEFSLGGAWVPAHQDRVRVTLTLPPTPRKEPSKLYLEGRAVIQGKEVIRQAVPAEDMMQAFIYHHLVPSEEWLVSVSGRGRRSGGVKLLGEEPAKIAAGGTSRIRLSAPRGLLTGQVKLELSEPPEGIAIQKISPEKNGVSILLSVEDGKVKPGLKGNLIVNAFTERAQRSKSGTKKTRNRRVPLGTLPAIPFEIVGRGF